MPRARRQPQPGRRPDARRNHVPFVRTRPHAAAVRHSPAHCRRKREGATQFPTIGLFERTRTILKEPETRRLKNRGHLARNRKFESISLQQRVPCEPFPGERSQESPINGVKVELAHEVLPPAMPRAIKSTPRNPKSTAADSRYPARSIWRGPKSLAYSAPTRLPVRGINAKRRAVAAKSARPADNRWHRLSRLRRCGPKCRGTSTPPRRPQ